MSTTINMAALTGVASTLLLVASVPSLAGPTAKLKTMTFTTKSAYNQVIHVESTDKQKWNKIKPGSVTFWGHMLIDTRWPGYVHEAGVVLGTCAGNTCGPNVSIYYSGAGKWRKFNTSKNFVFNPAILPVSENAIGIPNYGNHIIARCNEKLSADGPTQEHSFMFEMMATLGASTAKAINLKKAFSEVGKTHIGVIDHRRTGKFVVKVVCDPVPKPSTDTSGIELPPFKVNTLKLFLSTFSNAVSNPAAGVQCKKGRILVRARTTRPGPVKMRLWTKFGTGPTSDQFFEGWASQKPSGFYEVSFKKWVTVNGTKTLLARAVDESTPPFGPQDGWKSLSLKCTSPGGGGWAQTPDSGNPDGLPPASSKPTISVFPVPEGGKRPHKRPAITKPTTSADTLPENGRKPEKKRRKFGKRDAARKAAELRRKRSVAARKAAELRRKRAVAARKAAELRRKRAAAARKAAELRRKRAAAARKAAKLKRKRAATRKAAQIRRQRAATRRAAQIRRRLRAERRMRRTFETRRVPRRVFEQRSHRPRMMPRLRRRR